MTELRETDGVFHKSVPSNVACPVCELVGQVLVQQWDSSCGGWTDYRYTCGACKKRWWVEGSDA